MGRCSCWSGVGWRPGKSCMLGGPVLMSAAGCRWPTPPRSGVRPMQALCAACAAIPAAAESPAPACCVPMLAWACLPPPPVLLLPSPTRPLSPAELGLHRGPPGPSTFAQQAAQRPCRTQAPLLHAAAGGGGALRGRAPDDRGGVLRARLPARRAGQGQRQPCAGQAAGLDPPHCPGPRRRQGAQEGP